MYNANGILGFWWLVVSTHILDYYERKIVRETDLHFCGFFNGILLMAYQLCLLAGSPLPNLVDIWSVKNAETTRHKNENHHHVLNFSSCLLVHPCTMLLKHFFLNDTLLLFFVFAHLIVSFNA